MFIHSSGILSNVPALAAAYAPTIIQALSKSLIINHQQILGQVDSLNQEDVAANNQEQSMSNVETEINMETEGLIKLLK